MALLRDECVPDLPIRRDLAVLRRHEIAPSQVVSHRFPIAQGAEAFRLADTATTGKVCFAFA
jgi:threonine dehydrogenase-like Zn-dependent dehydrogenase